MLSMLIRDESGDREGGRVVQVPSVAAEDQRHLPRAWETLTQERARTATRLKGVLRSQGRRLPSLSPLSEQLEALRRWDGSPLPSGLRRRGLRVGAHHEFLSQQMAEGEAERRALLDSAQGEPIAQGRQLMHRNGLGIHGAWGLVRELFAWRVFKHRRAGGAGRAARPRHSQAAHVRGNPASPRRLIGMCAGCPRRWPGVGYVPSRRGPCVVGCEHALGAAANVCGGLAWWRWRGSGSLRWGAS